MPVKPADELAAYFDTAVAAALRDWEEGSRGEVSLPRSRWRAKGYTAAELAAIVVALPGQGPQKLIVKVHPGGRYARETGRHAEAIATSGVFAEQHLVRQPFLRHPVGDGRYLMFQDIAGGDLLESRPLSELPAEGLVAVCDQVARSLLEDWNDQGWRKLSSTAAAYVAAELKDLDEEGSARRWGEPFSLLDPSCDCVTTDEDGDSRTMPNPYRLASEQSLANEISIDYLAGRSHGDLHLDNVLVLQRLSERLQPERFWLIDLSGYSSSAPLTRDPVMLMLSIVSKEFPMSPGQQDALIDFVITPRVPEQAPYALTRALRDTVWAIYERGRGWARGQGWGGEWRAQYLLSVLSTALLYTSFDRVHAEGQRWFFRLAARAGAAFLKEQSVPLPPTTPCHIGPGPPSAGPDGAGTTAVPREDPPVDDPPARVTSDPRVVVPDDLSGLHAILIGLYSDHESARRAARRLSEIIQYPTFEDIEDVWAAILQEASKMDLISILDIINNEDDYADKPHLIRAARQCQRRWKPNFGAIAELAGTYRAELDAINVNTGRNSRPSDEDDDCIAQTIDLRELLCRLISEAEKPFRWWAALHDDFDDQAMTDVLRRSLDLVDLLRIGGTSSYRRRQLFGELQRLCGELVRVLDHLASADP